MDGQPPPPPAPPSQAAPPYHQAPFHHLLQQQNQQLQMFWNYQRQEVAHANDFKNHQLPLARIKKIMKADEDVRMISAEAPVLFAKACELFILELTIRSWLHAEENKRRTLQKNDVAAAIARTDIFDFLVDIVPREEVKEEGLGIVHGGGGGGVAAGSATGVPYYYPAIGQAAPPGMMMGQPAQPWQQMWQQGLPVEGSYMGGTSLDGQEDLSHQPPPPPPPPPPSS